jgi:hypothetical protein
MSFPYLLPTFNLTANIWRYSNWNGALPPVGAPDVVSLCNMALGRRGARSQSVDEMWFLFPKLTDVRLYEFVGLILPSGNDAIECPAGSGNYYAVGGVSDAGKGFSNEHRVAIAELLYVTTLPMP